MIFTLKKLRCLTALGKTLLVQKQVSENTQINVSDYQAGIYFLRMETKENSVVKQFLITK